MVASSSAGLFPLGHCVVTCGVRECLGHKYGERWHAVAEKIVSRHHNGDWSEMGELDKALNSSAALSGEGRVLTSLSHDGVKFFVITEADRSVTTVLLPEEY